MYINSHIALRLLGNCPLLWLARSALLFHRGLNRDKVGLARIGSSPSTSAAYFDLLLVIKALSGISVRLSC